MNFMMDDLLIPWLAFLMKRWRGFWFWTWGSRDGGESIKDVGRNIFYRVTMHGFGGRCMAMGGEGGKILWWGL